MNYETAVAALTKFGPITRYQYSWYKLVKTAITHNEARVLSSKWCQPYQLIEPVDELNIHEQYTYEDCVITTITTKNNRLIFEIVVYDGDTFNGVRTTQRCKFVVEFDILNNMVRDEIYKLIRCVAEQQIEEEDLAAIKLREDKRVEELLADLTISVEAV